MKHTYKKLMMVFVMTMALGWAASTANAQLVAGWTFEEGAGTVAKDHLGYGIDLFLYGDAVYDTDVPPPLVGISTHSVVFDGNGDYGEVGSYAEPYLNPGGGPWTIMCWEKTIAFINNGTFMDKAYNYRMAQYAGQLEGFMHWGPGIGEYVTGGDLSDSDWHHVAVSYDGQFMKGYVDGIEVGSKDVGGPGDSSASTFRIARRSISWGAYFNGKIDEVAIFLEVLDQPVIENFMNYGIGYYNGPLPPWVNAEPEFATVIPTGAGIPGELEIYGAAIDNTPWPPSDPCGLTAYWEMVDGPPGGSVTFATDPNNLQNTAYFTVDVVGVYHLQIYATDGYFEATDQIEVDVKHYSYTGLQNHWAFDNDLQDTAPIASPYSINNDYLESRGALAPFYGEGVAGDAVHVGHTDFANNWCWLETSLLHDSPDLELNQAFTVEMYLNPQIDKAPTESDALKWQDLVGKWFTYTTGQETHFESWEFVLNNGYPLMNVSDKSDIILPRTYDNVRSGEPLDPYEFPRIDGWQHLAFTGDGAGNISIYIDGIKTGSGQLPNAEFVDTDAPLRIANVLINSNGGVGRPSPYVGWIDELKFYEFDQPPEYFIERARLISIQGPEPIDGEQFAKQDVVLAWAPVKGYPNETPTYDVYFARDGQPLTQIATGITDTFYDPCEVGGAPLLNFDTTYNWKVVAHHSQGTTDSAEWSFKTIPANFGGMLGSALIGHWRLDEGAGTVAHDSAGCDDVAYYYYPAVGDKLPVQWIPGWVVGAPAHAIQFRSFEYLYVEPCDPDDYINLPKGDYTLSCWMKTTPEFIFDDADFIGFGTSYGIGRDESAQVVEFQHGGFSGDTTSGTTPVGDGYWHHVAAVYEAPTRTSDGMVYLYVDGGLDATEKVDDNHTIDSQAQLRFAGNSSEVNNFTGALDDIRIYRRALSAIEVQYIIDPPLINAPPQIHLGDDTVVPYPNDTLILKAALYDDNYPLQQSPRLAWTKLAGPGDVNFDPCIVAPGDLPGFVPDVEYELETTITFSQPGFYTLRAKTDDLIYTDTDQIMVWVQPAAGMDRTVAYWRFEQDQKETDYPDTPDGDNPNTLIIANEIAGAPPLIATRDIAEEVPLLLGNVPVTPIPLTDSDNLHHLAQGAGLRDFWGDRRVTSGYDLNMQADYWPGLLFCRDGLTIECWIKTDDQDFTAFDLFGDGKGIKIYHDDSNPSAGLKLECYFETEVPNIFEHVILVTDIKLTADKWIHIAFTYEKSNGVIRIFADGIPAWITHYYYDGAWTEARPWINSFNTPDNRALALPENGNLFINTGINTEDSALDELRISAATLYPPRFLNVGPTLCVTPVPADLDGDCDVDLIDFMLFGNSWLLCNNADLTECFKKQ